MKRLLGLATAGCLIAAGCAPSSPAKPEVVVYCALDRGFSEPVLDRFQQETGVGVRAVYDTESTKSVGLRQRILREAHRPRCDVFWNNEIINTLRLKEAHVLEKHDSKVGRQYPSFARSADNDWYGFAARVRVLLVNTDKVTEEQTPKRLVDLTDPKWNGEVGIAKPLFGTTPTHLACLFAHWGEDETKKWLRKLKENDVKILAGNKQVAVAVGAGNLAMGLTDTDDALGELHANKPVKMVFLELGAEDLGMLFIPNTVCLIKGCPHPEQGRMLIDYLLSAKVEEQLATGKSGQIPLHPEANVSPQLGIPQDAKRMEADFQAAATHWDHMIKFVRDEFTVP